MINSCFHRVAGTVIDSKAVSGPNWPGILIVLSGGPKQKMYSTVLWFSDKAKSKAIAQLTSLGIDLSGGIPPDLFVQLLGKECSLGVEGDDVRWIYPAPGSVAPTQKWLTQMESALSEADASAEVQ